LLALSPFLFQSLVPPGILCPAQTFYRHVAKSPVPQQGPQEANYSGVLTTGGGLVFYGETGGGRRRNPR